MTDMHHPAVAPPRKPDWIRVRASGGEQAARLRALVAGSGLHTVCSEALCPNLGRCWEHGRATVMILGAACTRNCRFCGVRHAGTEAPDADEPRRVAAAVGRMGLREVVITSVTRDDLPDGGSAIWAATIRAIHALAHGLRVEVLVPDFGGAEPDLRRVIDARPAVWGHNLETVPALYPTVRPQADYARSLNVLAMGHAAGRVAKTSLMLGLGETHAQVLSVMRDARAAGCRIFFLGQYLQPTRRHLPVTRYVEPEEFDAFRAAGRAIGFDVVVAAPLVRSSYHSDEQSSFLDGVAPDGDTAPVVG
jgi:lipoic acid synthetase